VKVLERARLSQISGVLDNAVKITHEPSGSVRYDLEIKPTNGDVVKLTVPEGSITEAQVRRLLGQPLIALYTGTKDVWELSSGRHKDHRVRQDAPAPRREAGF
jgi:hypothetical protein